jgi:hypothetical protein
MKIITKIMANRLAQKLNDLVSVSQMPSLRRDAYNLYVQKVIRSLHRKNKKALFIKLDISKAFDMVHWTYILEVLQALGLGQKWRDWICAILATSSSRVIVNGELCQQIRHARGLRQGDPRSPMLFILAIDPLQRIIELAARAGIMKTSITQSCSPTLLLICR